MIVVAFHLLETYSKGPAYQVLNHGYLAVRLLLRALGLRDRLTPTTTAGTACRSRASSSAAWCVCIRWFIMGSLIGALFFYFGSAAFPMIAGVQWWEVLLICLLGCTRLPALPSWSIRGWGETSPLNGPAWSLLYEYIANILYALVIRRFPKFVLGPVRGRGRGADAGPHAESRPVRPAGNPDAPLGTGIFVNVAIFLLAVGLA